MLRIGVQRYKPPHSFKVFNLRGIEAHICAGWANSNYCFHFEWIKLLEQWLTIYRSAKHGFANIPSCICVGLLLFVTSGYHTQIEMIHLNLAQVFLAVFKRTISWHNIGTNFDPPLVTSNFRLLVKLQILFVVPDLMVKHCRNEMSFIADDTKKDFKQ